MGRRAKGKAHFREEILLILRGLVVALALAGLADSFYFTFAYYGNIKKARWVPQALCAREKSSCVTVVRTSFGRIFGVPNSLLGIVYYALLIVWAGAGESMAFGFQVGMASYSLSFTGLMIATSAVAVALGFYLIYALRRILHVDCPFCYAAHGINVALLVLLVLSI